MRESSAKLDFDLEQLCYLPVDVPSVPLKEEIIAAFRESESQDYAWWNRDIILGREDYDHPLGTYPTGWSERAEKVYQPLIDVIQTHLPLDKIFYVHIAKTIAPVWPHVDENYTEKTYEGHMTILPSIKKHLEQNEPVGYRFLLQGERTKGLYMCQQYDPRYREQFDQPKTFCRIPDTTDFYLVRNGEPPHGVDLDPRFERIGGTILASVDPQRHLELIQKSYAKYGEFAIMRSDIR